MKKKITWVAAIVVAAALVIVGMAVARDARLKASDENVYDDVQSIELNEDTTAEVSIPRSVRVRSSLEGMSSVEIGTEVTLSAELIGFDNTVIDLQWQYTEDGEVWCDLENEKDITYKYLIDEENYLNQYRVLVNVIEEPSFDVIEPAEEASETNTEAADSMEETTEEIIEEEIDEETAAFEEIADDTAEESNEE